MKKPINPVVIQDELDLVPVEIIATSIMRIDVAAFRTMKDGREICDPNRKIGKDEYKRRREQAWDRDRGICCLCGLFVSLEECTAEHIIPRGMGGSKRDDRLSNLGVSHLLGNNARGSQAMDVYLALPLEVRVQNCKGAACAQ